MTAFDLDSLEVRWQRDQDHASHLILYEGSGELVTGDGADVVVLDVATGTELARVAERTGHPVGRVPHARLRPRLLRVHVPGDQPRVGRARQSTHGGQRMSIEVTLLGTGSPLPNPDRAGPATLVRAGDATLLVDCGRGVVMRLTAAGVLPVGLSAVLLTHLHSDHITDLNDVITTHWVMSPAPTPLRIVRPAGHPGGDRRAARDARARPAVPPRPPRRPHAGAARSR